MNLQKAYFKNLDTGKELSVQFNPTELSFSKAAQFAEIAIPGLDQPVLQFVRGGVETLTVRLFFDSTDGGMGSGASSVVDGGTNGAAKYGGVDDFYALVKQNAETHAPPKCQFGWGAEKKSPAPTAGATAQNVKGGGSAAKAVTHAPFCFNCVVESIEREFLLFSPEGVPLRARLTVRMREYQTVEEMVRGLHSADHTKMRVLKSRERLDQISAREYETPFEWRMIAEANDIDNPRLVKPGTMLNIPPMRPESVTKGGS